MIQEALPELSSQSVKNNRDPDYMPESHDDAGVASRLIAFPGTSRTVPAWRKQLSQRVREVQERKAREAAEELAAAQEAGLVSCALPSGQLELVPDLEQPVMNPIVSKALERLERARQGEPIAASYGRAAAAAAAMAPEIDQLTDELLTAQPKPKLTVVSTAPEVAPAEAVNDFETSAQTDAPETDQASWDSASIAINTTERKPVRVISEDDAALSYLDTCLHLPALTSDTRPDIPGLSRRFIGGVLDLILIALMVSPAGAAVYYSGGKWTDPRVLELLGGITLVTMFAYMTMSIAFTGRTLAMRILSLRTIDLRTGLIPTGGQSLGRAIGFVFSLAFLGLGQAYALVDRDQRTVYDRLSNTIVVRT
jgi:uncharacterized RDD family membrane protein YckC